MLVRLCVLSHYFSVQFHYRLNCATQCVSMSYAFITHTLTVSFSQIRCNQAKETAAKQLNVLCGTPFETLTTNIWHTFRLVQIFFYSLCFIHSIGHLIWSFSFVILFFLTTATTARAPIATGGDDTILFSRPIQRICCMENFRACL